MPGSFNEKQVQQKLLALAKQESSPWENDLWQLDSKKLKVKPEVYDSGYFDVTQYQIKCFIPANVIYTMEALLDKKFVDAQEAQDLMRLVKDFRPLLAHLEDDAKKFGIQATQEEGVDWLCIKTQTDRGDGQMDEDKDTVDVEKVSFKGIRMDKIWGQDCLVIDFDIISTFFWWEEKVYSRRRYSLNNKFALIAKAIGA